MSFSSIHSTKIDSYSKNNYNFNIILLGNVNVGKTAILKRFIDNKYNESYNCTLGVELKKKKLKIGNNNVSLTLWDTCGEERFMSITKQYYKEKDGIIVVFDLSNRSSFLNLVKWMNEINDNASDNTEIIIVGNKFDLIEYNRVVSMAEIESFLYSLKLELEYIEVSAKENINIDDIFITLSNGMIKKSNVRSNNVSTISESVDTNLKSFQFNRRRRSDDEIVFEYNTPHNKKKGNCC